MTMIIDKNHKLYENVIAIRNKLKSLTDKEIEQIENDLEDQKFSIDPMLKRYRDNNEFITLNVEKDIIERLLFTDVKDYTTVNGIEDQVERFTSKKDYVYYAYHEYGVTHLDRLVVAAKEVDDE